MQFGLFLLLQTPSARPPEEIYARGTEIAQAGDDLGFDSIWLAEHHFSTYGYLARPLMYALHLANQTKRIRVGSAVVVVPLHHPLVIAEEIATAAKSGRANKSKSCGRCLNGGNTIRTGEM